ncbi:hypothetical protein [Paenibacillus tyrfis]|uniref:Uncharacterized protein n=1 Tax=Paenibacillus tyrfis TaxID=1501230 RepID=A0A081NTA2_9BACL|nr:hypothetical protein [Paenibacillus tyrfis]KEQ21675.1 hypothetical protein ET33_34470 [Paenibacillus tyrfis]
MKVTIIDLTAKKIISVVEMNNIPQIGSSIFLFRAKSEFKVHDVVFFIDEEKQNETEVTLYVSK